MSVSRDDVHARYSPSANAPDFHPSSYLEHVSGQQNNLLQPGRSSATTGSLQPSPATANHRRNRPESLTRASSTHPSLWLKSMGFEGLVITAVAIITILLNMVTSNSIANTTVIRAFLFFGMTFELLAIILAICFLNTRDWQQLPTILSLASGLPVVFLLMGTVVLAAALVVEMLKASFGVAVAMGGFLIFGIVLGLLTSFFGA